MSSELYKKQIENCNNELMHKVWDGTPWMVNAYTGSSSHDERYRQIMEWCRDKFGQKAWPIHGKPGKWHSGGATVRGWTWMGFATKEMMEEFLSNWPAPAEAMKGR